MLVSREEYIKIRKDSKDPIKICLDIFNLKSPVPNLSYNEFQKLFTFWLASRWVMGVIRGATKVVKDYDTHYNAKIVT